MADKELLAIPVITFLLNVFLFGVLVAVFAMTTDITKLFPEEGQALSMSQWGFIFACYVIGAFSLSAGQAGVSNTVFTRAHGDNATLFGSLRVAFSHWFSLLLWSVITSTVGIVLRSIAERSQLLGKILTMILGSAWSVLTYFVVPAMVIDKKTAFASIGTSARVFKATWGETVVSNISLSAIFLIAVFVPLLSLIGISVVGSVLNSPSLIIVSFLLYAVWLLVSLLVFSVMGSILRTLLYMYASDSVYPDNFNSELLGQMLVRTNTSGAVPTPPASTLQ